MEDKGNVDYHAFLLRLWRDGENAAWRASLEDPYSGERHNFGSLQQLWSFFQERLRPDVGSGMPREPLQ